MNQVRNVIAIAIIGIVGIVIVMSVVIGTNMVGWSGTMNSMVSTIIPIVMGAGIIMLVLYASMGSGKKDL